MTRHLKVVFKNRQDHIEVRRILKDWNREPLTFGVTA